MFGQFVEAQRKISGNPQKVVGSHIGVRVWFFWWNYPSATVQLVDRVEGTERQFEVGDVPKFFGGRALEPLKCGIKLRCNRRLVSGSLVSPFRDRWFRFLRLGGHKS